MLIYKAIISKDNNRSYIGRTTSNILSHRSKEHIRAVKKGSNYYFHNAIRKYGYETVQWEVLEDNIIDFEYLKERETFNILKYDTFKPNGYNMTLGGDGMVGFIFSEESKQRMSQSHIGKQTGNKHPMYGKHHSKESNNKNSQWHILNPFLKHSEESKQKIKENHANFSGKNNPNFGKNRSEESKKKSSIALKMYYQNKKKGI